MACAHRFYFNPERFDDAVPCFDYRGALWLDGSIANANYYFAHEGRWIDVHASIYPPTDKEAETLQQFEKSLKLGHLPADVANDGEPTPSKEN